MGIPRPEYPRPQLVREKWMNLNGEWEFEIDHGMSGRERGLHNSPGLSGRITVPFCPESRLSGVGYKDFMSAVWYRRAFSLPADWAGGRVLLHLGACDYETEVWVNGASAGVHRGGYSSFTFDVTPLLREGENALTVCAKDDARSGRQPAGKQSNRYDSYGCSYTRTTGIWQTVWLEAVPCAHIASLRLTPDVGNNKLDVAVTTSGLRPGMRIEATASYEGREAGAASVSARWNGTMLSIPLSELHLWEPGHGRLYDLELRLTENGEAVDSVQSYFGMRSVELYDGKILINGKPVFQRLILDQGFFPDGIYTAPSDGELKRDIERAMAMGFNGARLHEKVFEPRFYYWADRLGYLCWGEHANWMMDERREEALLHFLPEWAEIVERDYSHPSLVGWCPFNETRREQEPRVIDAVYRVTKQLDPFRPVIDTSGYVHVATDVFDCHDYEQSPEKLKAHFEPLLSGGTPFINHNAEGTYDPSLPFFVSEFGGIWWAPGKPGWGYGESPRSEEEFVERYRGLVDALLGNPKICAFCYTQLTDVEQEVNGLYTYGREPKFDPAVIRGITAKKAAIEE